MIRKKKKSFDIGVSKLKGKDNNKTIKTWFRILRIL